MIPTSDTTQLQRDGETSSFSTLKTQAKAREKSTKLQPVFQSIALTDVGNTIRKKHSKTLKVSQIPLNIKQNMSNSLRLPLPEITFAA